jgi:hypothetical protein
MPSYRQKHLCAETTSASCCLWHGCRGWRKGRVDYAAGLPVGTLRGTDMEDQRTDLKMFVDGFVGRHRRWSRESGGRSFAGPAIEDLQSNENCHQVSALPQRRIEVQINVTRSSAGCHNRPSAWYYMRSIAHRD